MIIFWVNTHISGINVRARNQGDCWRAAGPKQLGGGEMHCICWHIVVVLPQLHRLDILSCICPPPHPSWARTPGWSPWPPAPGNHTLRPAAAGSRGGDNSCVWSLIKTPLARQGGLLVEEVVMMMITWIRKVSRYQGALHIYSQCPYLHVRRLRVLHLSAYIFTAPHAQDAHTSCITFLRINNKCKCFRWLQMFHICTTKNLMPELVQVCK